MSNSPVIRLIVSIDTEEDNWVPSREGITTTNVVRLPALDRRFEALGVRATYFTNYQPLIEPAAADVIRALHASGRAEIGAHLHPWNTPPLTDPMHTMLLNVPPEFQTRKIAALRERFAEIGIAPHSFRAGRFGLGPSTVRALIASGFAIDSSVTPFFSWEEEDGGPSYEGAPMHLYRLSGNGDVRIPDGGPLVEVPLSCGYNRWHPSTWSRLHARLYGRDASWLLRSVAARTRIARRVILSPEPHGLADLVGLARSLVAGGLPFLHVFWHSSSMMPGLTPFCRTAADVDRLLSRFERLLDAIAREASLKFVTVAEAVADLEGKVASAAPRAMPDTPVSILENPVLAEPVVSAAATVLTVMEPPVAGSDTEAEEAAPVGRMGRHTAIYLAGMLLSRTVAFVMLPFYTRFLSPADYGVMQLLDMALDIISIIAGTRIASGIHRYYFKAETLAERNAVLSTAFLLLAGSFFTFGLATFSLAGPLTVFVLGDAEHTNLMRISAVTFALQTFVIVPLAVVQLWKRSVLSTSLGILKLVIQLSLNILFLGVVGLGVTSVFLSTLIANVVLGTIVTTLVLRQIGLRFSGGAARDLVRYGTPLMVTQLATFFVTYGDRYFLRVSADASQVGLYSLAYQFGFLVAAIGYVPFALIWEPTRFQLANRADRDVLYARAFIFMNLLQLIVSVGTALFVRDVITIMADEAFHPAHAIVPTLVLAYLLQSWAYFHEVGILVKERTGFVTLANWVAAGVCLILYIVLIPRWLGWGAAIATLIAFLVRWIIIYVIAQRLMRVRYEWTPVLRMLVLSIGFVGVGMALPHPGVALSLAIRAALMGAFLFAIWHVGAIQAEDKKKILAFVRSPATALRGFRS